MTNIMEDMEASICSGYGQSGYAVHIIYMCLYAISGSLSIIGSLIIIFIILRGGQTRLSRLHNRLILGSSSIDVLYSIALGLSSIPSPQLDDCSYGYGNASSCTAQGFFLTLGLSVPGYTSMLSIYYLATVVYSKTEEMIAQKFEPFMHAYAVLPVLVCASIGASKRYFFSQSGQCWIADPCLYSKECDGWDGLGKGGWLAIASIIWVVINSLVTLYCMVIIYYQINNRARAMRRYSVSQASPPVPGRMEVAANDTAIQGLLYMSAFLLTYSWAVIIALSEFINGEGSSHMLFILTAVFLPLQGFWNFLAYIRPRFVKLRRGHLSLSFFSTLKTIIFFAEDPSLNRPKRQKRWRNRRFEPDDDAIEISDDNDDDDDAPLEDILDVCEKAIDSPEN